MGAGGGTVGFDGDRVASGERQAHARRIPHGRAEHDHARICPQVVGDAQQSAHDERDMRSGHPTPVVGLVDDDKPQGRQEARPTPVGGQHDVVQKIRV